MDSFLCHGIVHVCLFINVHQALYLKPTPKSVLLKSGLGFGTDLDFQILMIYGIVYLGYLSKDTEYTYKRLSSSCRNRSRVHGNGIKLINEIIF
jgi:hypothetical protein